MFRALALARAEDEGFQDHSSFVQDQTNTFTKQLPNPYLSGLPTSSTTTPQTVLQNAFSGLATYDPNTRQARTQGIELDKYATSVEVNQDLLNQASQCETATLDGLLNTYNPSSKLRCGWIYKKGQGSAGTSRGALGTRRGPAGFVQTPPGKWFWDLEEAKQVIEGDKCADLTVCTDVGSSRFQGCAYSTTRGVGVPIDTAGTLKYPRVAALSAPSSSLVTDKSKCPPPPTPGSPQAEYQRSRDLCTPLANGALSRDCMLQQVTVAGCKMDGSLYRALINQATPDNYGAGLQQLTSYKKYQQLASQPLFESSLRDGKTSIAVALDNFRGLAVEAGKTAETALNYAAKDLCLKQGTMDTFDFCTELKDQTSAPFALECIQKEFRSQGGQPAGQMYPTAVNLDAWNRLGNWGKIKEIISAIRQQSNSQDEAIQREALKNFLGIVREPASLNQIPAMRGLEVLWFNRGTNTFLGRRTNIVDPQFPLMEYNPGEVDGTGLYDFVEFYAFTNVRPPSTMDVRMRVESDDGIALALNRQVDGVATRGQFADSSSQLIANWDQAPTTWTNKTCWKLRKGGANYVMAFWQETGGWAHSKILYSPCKEDKFQTFPADWLTLTQEPDAPMLSWEGSKSTGGSMDFYEHRLPTVMELRKSPQTTVVDSTLGPVLKLRQNGSGTAVLTKSIATNSFRSMALTFVCGFQAPPTQFNARGYADLYPDLKAAFGYNENQLLNHWNQYGQRENRLGSGLAGANILFQFGPITIYTVGYGCITVYKSATLDQVVSFGNLLTDGQTPYTLILTMESDTKSAFPNRLTIAGGPKGEWTSGRISLSSPGPARVSVTTANNTALYARSDAFPFTFGDSSRASDAAIVRLRLFDYALDDADVSHELNNGWQMKFI